MAHRVTEWGAPSVARDVKTGKPRNEQQMADAFEALSLVEATTPSATFVNSTRVCSYR
jgi:hypothetical protein